MAEKDFYPYVVMTDPPRVVAREEMETYFKIRGTVVKVTHMPATNPREERIDSDLYRK